MTGLCAVVRISERFASEQNTYCHAATMAGADPIPACVKDVSRTGIGLVRQLEIHLIDSNQTGRKPGKRAYILTP